MTILGAIEAFVYVAALWLSAPVFFRDVPQIPDRLRASIILGVGLPGVLGLLGILYAPLLWIVLAVLVGFRFYRRLPAPEPDLALLVTLAATVIVSWPSLTRPLLDGDTLLYHFPNAVAFVQDHSLWTARAPFWLYPPASELFAGGLFAVSGTWSLPLCGILPALLITARIYAVGRAAGSPAYVAAGTALAFTFMPIVAFQVGTLQNDLWLAAFFVEVLTCADRSPGALAICALLKPFGWIEGLIAACAARLAWRTVLLAFVPLIVWCVRDYALLSHGVGLGFDEPPYVPSTIAGNIAIAFPGLLHGIATVTPQSFALLAALAIGIAVGPRRYAWAGVAVLAAYAFLPSSYQNAAINYVLDASSLRYALAALACGALVVACLARRTPLAWAIVTYSLAAWGACSVLAVFWNDSYTHRAIIATIVAIGAALMARKTRGLSIACAALAIVVVGSLGASTRETGFYQDWMRDASGNRSGILSWIAANKPDTIVAENLRIGAILVASPQTRAYDDAFSEACNDARSKGALLVLGRNEIPMSDSAWMSLVTAARACGTPLYEDTTGVIVRPQSHP